MDPDVSAIAEKLMLAGAFPESSPDKHVLLQKSDALYAPAKRLEDQEVLCSKMRDGNSSFFTFSQSGLARVVPSHEICVPRYVFPDATSLANQALENLTSWELQHLLTAEGFTLCQLPRSQKARRKLPPHTPDCAQQIWYCQSTPLQHKSVRAYMITLLQAPVLFEGTLRRIHHGETFQYHEALLDPESAATGELPELPQPLADSGPQLEPELDPLQENSDLALALKDRVKSSPVDRQKARQSSRRPHHRTVSKDDEDEAVFTSEDDDVGASWHEEQEQASDECQHLLRLVACDLGS